MHLTTTLYGFLTQHPIILFLTLISLPLFFKSLFQNLTVVTTTYPRDPNATFKQQVFIVSAELLHKIMPATACLLKKLRATLTFVFTLAVGLVVAPCFVNLK